MSDAAQRLLVSLVRLTVGVDGQIDDSERDAIASIADEMGHDAFWRLMDQAAHVSTTEEQLLKASRAISDSEEHELIYGALYELSLQNGIHPAEARILDRLAKLWRLTITTVVPDTPRGPLR